MLARPHYHRPWKFFNVRHNYIFFSDDSSVRVIFTGAIVVDDDDVMPLRRILECFFCAKEINLFVLGHVHALINNGNFCVSFSLH